MVTDSAAFTKNVAILFATEGWLELLELLLEVLFEPGVLVALLLLDEPILLPEPLLSWVWLVCV